MKNHPIRQVAALATYLRDKYPGLVDELNSGDTSPANMAIQILDEGDMLERMWQAQIALNETTFDANSTCCIDENGPLPFWALIKYGEMAKTNVGNLRNFKHSATIQKWIINYVTAIQQEIAELRDSTNWKWWRSKVDKFDLQNIWVELVDILHFWMSACMVAGLSPRDVYKMYREKNKVNFERQESGYIVKDENDSKHLAPEA